MHLPQMIRIMKKVADDPQRITGFVDGGVGGMGGVVGCGFAAVNLLHRGTQHVLAVKSNFVEQIDDVHLHVPPSLIAFHFNCVQIESELSISRLTTSSRVASSNLVVIR